MKKLTALVLISITLASCKKETQKITKIDPKTGDTITVEVPVESDSTKTDEGGMLGGLFDKKPIAIDEVDGVYTQKFILEKGKTYPLNTSTKETQTLTDPSGKSASGSTLSVDNMSFTVNDFANGIYDITINLIGKKTSQTFDGKTVSVDTSKPAPKDENQKMIWTVNKALSGNKLNLKMDEAGNIKSITGFDAIYNKINSSTSSIIKDAEQKKGFTNSFKQSFNEATIKDQFINNIHILPVKGAKVGEKWTKSENASPDGKIKFTTNYVLKSVENGVATISVSGGIPTQSDKQTQDGVTRTVSSGVTQNGTITLDANSGWITKHTLNIKTTQKESYTDGKQSESMSSVSNTTVTVN